MRNTVPRPRAPSAPGASPASRRPADPGRRRGDEWWIDPERGLFVVAFV